MGLKSIVVSLLVFALSSCSTISYHYQAQVEVKSDTGETSEFEVYLVKSIPATGTVLACAITGIFYGGLCWTYLMKPYDSDKRALRESLDYRLQKVLKDEYRITKEQVGIANYSYTPEHLSVWEDKKGALAALGVSGREIYAEQPPKEAPAFSDRYISASVGSLLVQNNVELGVIVNQYIEIAYHLQTLFSVVGGNQVESLGVKLRSPEILDTVLYLYMGRGRSVFNSEEEVAKGEGFHYSAGLEWSDNFDTDIKIFYGLSLGGWGRHRITKIDKSILPDERVFAKGEKEDLIFFPAVKIGLLI